MTWAKGFVGYTRLVCNTDNFNVFAVCKYPHVFRLKRMSQVLLAIKIDGDSCGIERLRYCDKKCSCTLK